MQLLIDHIFFETAMYLFFDLMDDSLNICKSVSSEKIHSIYLKDAPSSETKDSLYLKTLYNWGEIYRYLNENKKASDN